MKVNRLKTSMGAKLSIAMGASLTIAGLICFAMNGSPGELHRSNPIGVDPVSSTLYLFTGLLGMFAGMCGKETSRGYFRFCGVMYGVLALMAIVYLDKANFGWLTNDAFHAVFHFAVASFALMFGFGNLTFQTPHLSTHDAHDRHVIGFPNELVHH